MRRRARRPRAQVRERSDARVAGDGGVGDDAVVVNRDAIADSRIDDPHAAVDVAAAADRRRAFERHAGMDDRVGAHRDVAIDEGRRRVLDGDARGHQFGVLFLSHDATHLRQFGAAVDPANLVGI